MFPNNFILFSVSSLVKIRLILDDTLFNIHTLYLLLEDALLSLYIIKMRSSWRSSYRIDRKRRFKSEFKYRFRCDSHGGPWRFQGLPGASNSLSTRSLRRRSSARKRMRHPNDQNRNGQQSHNGRQTVVRQGWLPDANLWLTDGQFGRSSFGQTVWIVRFVHTNHSHQLFFESLASLYASGRIAADPQTIADSHVPPARSNMNRN